MRMTQELWRGEGIPMPVSEVGFSLAKEFELVLKREQKPLTGADVSGWFKCNSELSGWYLDVKNYYHNKSWIHLEVCKVFLHALLDNEKLRVIVRIPRLTRGRGDKFSGYAQRLERYKRFSAKILKKTDHQIDITKWIYQVMSVDSKEAKVQAYLESQNPFYVRIRDGLFEAGLSQEEVYQRACENVRLTA